MLVRFRAFCTRTRTLIRSQSSHENLENVDPTMHLRPLSSRRRAAVANSETAHVNPITRPSTAPHHPRTPRNFSKRPDSTVQQGPENIAMNLKGRAGFKGGSASARFHTHRVVWEGGNDACHGSATTRTRRKSTGRGDDYLTSKNKTLEAPFVSPRLSQAAIDATVAGKCNPHASYIKAVTGHASKGKVVPALNLKALGTQRPQTAHHRRRKLYPYHEHNMGAVGVAPPRAPRPASAHRPPQEPL